MHSTRAVRVVRAALLGAFAVAAIFSCLAKAQAGNVKHLHHVYVYNRTPDAWVWVTVYKSWSNPTIERAFCVKPDYNELFTYKSEDRPYDIRFELEKKDCSHPVMLDRTMGWDGVAPYFVTGSAGRYRVAHTL